MIRFLRPLGQALLILFCLWHMAAVGVYAIPASRIGDVVRPIKQWVRPYILFTSQWQGWDLFSPDPLRRVTVYRILVADGPIWQPVATIGPDSLSMWRHADELKFLGRIDGTDDHRPLRVAYVRDFCRSHALPSRAAVRFVEHFYVLPEDAASLHAASQKNWKPSWRSNITAETYCP